MSKKSIEELFDGYNGEYEKEDINFGEPVGHEKFWEEDKLSDQEYLESIPGMKERILECVATPLSERIPESAVNWGARLAIRICRVKCNRCGDVLEYRHMTKTESPHVLLTCTCKTVTIDPVPMVLRILYKNEGDFTELHEYWEEPNEVTLAAFESEDVSGPYKSVAELFADLNAEEPNADAFEELEKVGRMKADPMTGKGYSNVDNMIKDVLSENQDEDALIDKVASDVLDRYRHAFEELAKGD